eukprot:TRINITY_DN6279_c0_g1_i1.p1 TRINITY_DN6279_c0_g1~~TRINITY_DN6279_c0_g1_i1.p1  ORF type:complete len:957 (+),score=177.36 TRINITY_DN6279_c0_g1_i1:1-2871(+)
MEFEFFIVGPPLKNPITFITLNGNVFSNQQLLGALEDALDLRVGSIEEARYKNIDTGTWDDCSSLPPPKKCKLWVKVNDAPAMLAKELIPNGSREFCDCRKILFDYLSPFLSSRPQARVALTKAEQLTNAESEHLYQVRRRQLNDPDNLRLLPVGGKKDVLKGISERGFQLPQEPNHFGRGAMVFGSNIRSVGEDVPEVSGSNKLLVCEVVIGVPKVATGPSPSVLLEELTAEGYDSLVLPANAHEEFGISYTVLYHPHQAVPKFMLTYSLEYLDPTTLCPVSGDEYTLVSKATGKLECLKCAVKMKDIEFEPLEMAAAREKGRFTNQQDELSTHLQKLRKEYQHIEMLNDACNNATDIAVERVSHSVNLVTERVRQAGVLLIEKARNRQQGVREKLDSYLVELQKVESNFYAVHDHLNSALSMQSDIQFQKGIAMLKTTSEQLQMPISILSSEPEIVRTIEELQHSTVDISKLLAECDSITLDHTLGEDVTKDQDNATAATTTVTHYTTQSVPAPVSDPGDPPIIIDSVPALDQGIRSLSQQLPELSQVQSKFILTLAEAESVTHSKRILLAFGKNDLGQLGIANQSAITFPSFTSISSHHAHMSSTIATNSIVLVAAGMSHTLCLTTDGRVYSFGSNTKGQLGLGHKTSTTTPTPIYSLSGSEVVQMACGDEHSLVLTTDNKVYSWGRNDRGQLGLGTTNDQDTPWVMTSLSDVVVTVIKAGAYHNACLSAAGEVLVWGCNRSHQLGVGSSTTVAYCTMPQKVAVPSTSKITVLELGGYHSVVMADSRSQIFVWGENSDARLGLGHSSVVASPRLLASLCNTTDLVKSISTSRFGTSVHTDSGRYLSWGGEGFPSQMPSTIPSLDHLNIPKSSRGIDHTLLLTSDGQVFCFGANLHGQLGLGDERTSGSSTPELLRLPSSITKHRHRVLDVIACCHHSFVIVAVAVSAPSHRYY